MIEEVKYTLTGAQDWPMLIVLLGWVVAAIVTAWRSIYKQIEIMSEQHRDRCFALAEELRASETRIMQRVRELERLVYGRTNS